MNKNRVRAFGGNAAAGLNWDDVFAHYFNLISCLELSTMGIWLEEKTGITLNPTQSRRLSNNLGILGADTLRELRTRIKSSISELQLYVNNPTSRTSPTLSMREAPLKDFAEALYEDGLLGDRIIFCCIDEYENLLDSQQAVLNTYIKHAEPPLSYKIGVRKNGLRNRQTGDGQDLLRTPDDYAEIEIADEGFEYFAREVAERRLDCAKAEGVGVPRSLGEFLEDLSIPDEAQRLGASKLNQKAISKLANVNPDIVKKFDEVAGDFAYFLLYWHEGTQEPIENLALDWIQNSKSWATRIGNHGYASLFWLSKGNKGVRIRKYYCGSRVFLTLPGGNIRFFLELIDEAISYELDSLKDGALPDELILSPRSQTLAARSVGQRRLNQLEGLADHGVQLKRLVLAIGKVFFEFARSPVGRTPEVTSFVVSGVSQDTHKIRELLNEGVAHLAFEVTPRTKATTNVEMRDDEYRLHRIFCGFFEISHRKKRRTTFDAKDLLSILEDKPSKAISAMLDGLSQTDEIELPAQLALFNAFYETNTEDAS